MFAYLLRRLALTVPTFVALMFITFVAIRLVPGDPVEVRTGERGISPERLAQFRHELVWTNRSGNSFSIMPLALCMGISALRLSPMKKC